MRIRTQFIISTAIFGVVLLAIAASLIVTDRRTGQTKKQEHTAQRLQQEASELSYLSSAYLLYREDHQLSRWESKFASLSDTLASLVPDSPEQGAILNGIAASRDRLKAIFSEVRGTLELESQRPDGGFDPSFTQVSWSRMEVQNQGMVFDASRLALSLHEQSEQLAQVNTLLSFGLIAMFGAFLFASYVLTYRRILSSISELQVGASVIGSGDLDFALKERTNDEIGDLSRAFNRMTASLKEVTASKADLEREIAERSKAEDNANRQKAIQEGINRILEAALTCETEEELGHISLREFERLTGSRFGFLGELNPQGRLDDLAISDPGWEACRIEDPVGHGKLPHDLAVHGIYGQVLRESKAFFTNDPSSHPDRIGTPEGHPPLTAFLGVPLNRGGKAMGMVGLGNRDGGYRVEDQEAAESLASAVVEALERKRAEEEIKHLNQDLSQHAAKLEASNKELEAFAYSVSHDLRAPLRSIEGFSRALLEDYEDKLDAEGKRYLQLVRSASQRMAQLIEDMLMLSRLSVNEMMREEVDLSALAGSIADDLQRSDPARRASFLIQVGMVVKGDPRLLRVALDNLLANAWKFTSTRPSARIEFGTEEAEGKYAFFIKDNGVGFDMAYAGKLFGAFQRLHSASEFPGTGIGLATVQRIIHRHGGRIWAESAKDNGATFRFTLGG